MGEINLGKIRGDNAYVHIRYGTSSTPSELLTEPNDYIGIYSGPLATAPEDYAAYKWSRYVPDMTAKADKYYTDISVNIAPGMELYRKKLVFDTSVHPPYPENGFETDFVCAYPLSIHRDSEKVELWNTSLAMSVTTLWDSAFTHINNGWRVAEVIWEDPTWNPSEYSPVSEIDPLLSRFCKVKNITVDPEYNYKNKQDKLVSKDSFNVTGQGTFTYYCTYDKHDPKDEPIIGFGMGSGTTLTRFFHRWFVLNGGEFPNTENPAVEFPNFIKAVRQSGLQSLYVENIGASGVGTVFLKFENMIANYNAATEAGNTLTGILTQSTPQGNELYRVNVGLEYNYIWRIVQKKDKLLSDADRVQVRQDTAVNWESRNPVLKAGEFGYDTTTKIVKIGDGTTAWNSLTALVSQADIPSVSLQKDSWSTIARISASGDASQTYSVGEEKTIRLSTNEVVTLVIMGFNHDNLSAGGKAGITFGMKNLFATTNRMNASNTNSGGWQNCEMRNTTLPTILARFPSDLQAAIKSVNKLATAGSQQTSIMTSADKLWLFSEVEIDNTTGTGYASEGVQYEYWRTIKSGTTAADRIKYLSNGTGAASAWWLRSPYVTYSTNFRVIISSGFVGSGSGASSACGVCVGFCV